MEKLIAQQLILPTIQMDSNASPIPTIAFSGPITKPGLVDSAGNITLGSIITEALVYLYPLAGFILFVFIIASGFQMLTANGDPKKIQSASARLTYAILGFILLVASPWIARIIQVIFSPEQPFF